MAKVINSSPAAPESTPKIAGVIVAHGHLAAELLAAAEMIVGPLAHVTSASISWHDDVDAAREEIERAIARVNQGRGVLLLTDMFGGAPMDIASMFLDDKGIEIVSGVNLPMVIKLANQTSEESASELAHRVCDGGKEAIHQASEILARAAKPTAKDS
jgi:PTS system mannose-specific IIA component